jgi:hypothetical protein
LGYYGVALNVKDEQPLVLPEELIIKSIRHLGNLDYSKMFSLILDWSFMYGDLLRTDIFLKEFSILESKKERKILCGLLELINQRKFKSVIQKISKTFDNEEYMCGAEGRVNSFGHDPVMYKYGIICSFIQRVRDEKKVITQKEITNVCEVFKSRLIIGANARADFFSFRKLFASYKISQVRDMTFTSKTSSVDFEKSFRVISLI